MSVLSFCVFLLTHTPALDRVDYELFSAATSRTSMDIDKAQDDEETDEEATSKAGMIL